MSVQVKGENLKKKIKVGLTFVDGMGSHEVVIGLSVWCPLTDMMSKGFSLDSIPSEITVGTFRTFS